MYNLYFVLCTPFLLQSLIWCQWHYISFDRFYTFGLAHYNRYTKNTWAKDMVVVPAGTFGATRKNYELRLSSRPDDIGIFVSSFVYENTMIALVRDLAEAFSKRTIWLQIKPTFLAKPIGQEFIKNCTKERPNIRPTSDGLFDLFPKVRYSFSDPSTVVVESMQFGCLSFMTDVSPIQKTSLYREFSGLCVTSGKAAIKRIKDIEAGRWIYPIEDYGELVDLSGRVFFDIIREDIGLSAKGV